MGFWGEEIFKEAEESSRGFEPLPEGNYRVILTDCEIKASKSGGHYINAKFELSGNPQYDGRVLFHKFNVDNASSIAVSIGLGQLKELSSAVGKSEWYEDLKTADSWRSAEAKLNTLFSACGNMPVEVKVVIRKDEQYGAQNDIKRFKQVSSGPSMPSAPASGKGGKKAPWEK